MDLTGCGGHSFLRYGFPECNKFYYNFYFQAVEYNNLMQCGNQCLRDKIYSAVNANETDCYDLQIYAQENFTKCYLDCGMCFAPEVIYQLETHHITSYYSTLAHEAKLVGTNCNQKYLNAVGKNWTLLEIKRKAHVFIDKFYDKTGLDLSYYFLKLLELESRF